MKTLLHCLTAASLLLAGCQVGTKSLPDASQATSTTMPIRPADTPTTQPKDSAVALPTATSTPASASPTRTTSPTKEPQLPAAPYADVRGKDIRAYESVLDTARIRSFWFNRTTNWPEQAKKIAEETLELGKNPGMGVRALHAQGITGKGVNVAIIDQNLILDHPEFSGKIAAYHDVGTGTKSYEGSMHAPAVTSLLVGDTTGTAPGARVYFVAAPSWNSDAKYQADALNWIIDENAKLPEGQKIRVVSISAAPSGAGSPFTAHQADWDAAYERAMKAGILVLDCTTQHIVVAPCYYDFDDPDAVEKCTPGWPGVSYKPQPNKIHVPTSLRTTAEEYSKGSYGYQFTGRGGMSWAVPYLSGVLAMGWQVRPEMTGLELLDLVFKTATIQRDIKIINPGAFIEALKKSKNP